MFETMKLSKYNFSTYDVEGNLIMYNFLTGIPSLTKIMKQDVNKFTQLFLTDAEIQSIACEGYSEAVNNLLQKGILVAADTNEEVLYDAKCYDEVYDSKLNLTILPTGQCNFRCPYCFETPQSFAREPMTMEAQKAILKYVQKAIPNHRALHISWFGGEPLLTPEIIKHLSEKFIQICNVRHLPYSADITTNGYLLDADMFDMLYKLKVYDYIITIDGVKEQHDRRRFTCDGAGTYDVIMKNLLRIRDNKQYKFANIMIRVNMSKGFIENLDEFIQELSHSFSDDARFRFVFVPVVKFSGSKFSDNNLYHNHGELFSQLFRNDTYMTKLYTDEQKISSIIQQKKCPAALKNSYVITPDLKVYKCNAHYDFDANKIGYISLNGSMLLDENLHRRWFLTGKVVNKVPDICKNCYYLPCCFMVNSGCPVGHLKPTPDAFSCPLEEEKRKKDIVDALLYAVNKYPCITITV